MNDYNDLITKLRCQGVDCRMCVQANRKMEKCLNKLTADAIESLQAQVPKRGKWVKKNDDNCWWFECSECGSKPLYSRFVDDDVLTQFCPFCGAKMEVGE